ncbi:hypothetical protein Rhal01_01016 [Rubritalea halochordaticola]|uniref:Serpin domain-containing protein n=1 Tax=Rubritalea halochordaticola TaxID=714537 RepID=A0ABP9V0M2_9BACT
MRFILITIFFSSCVLGGDLPVLSGVVNGFAVDVYQKVEKKQNFCYSPYALHAALSMIEVGAEKRTRDELYAGLKLLGERGDTVIQHANVYGDMVERYSRELPKQLEGKEDPLDLFLLNRIYLSQQRNYERDYLEIGRDVAGYGMEKKDFERDHQRIQKQVNAWVAHESFQRIENALPENAVRKDTSLLLLNGLFFQAPWHEPFDVKLTKPGGFHLHDGKVVQVPMMQREGKYGYLANSSWTAISLPFGQYSECHLVLIVPKVVDGLSGLEQNLKAKDLMDMRDLPQRTLRLHMPRFELKGESQPLMPALKGLGIKRAFDDPKGSAELTQIDATRNTVLGPVYQKSYFKIDEMGCDVLKASSAVLLDRVFEQPGRGFEFKADRAFLFLVQDCRTGIVLFMGRVVDPRAH